MAPKAASGKAKKAATHPKYSAMVAEAIRELKEHTGSSRQAITKYIQGKYHVGEAGARQVNAALKRGITKGELVHPKGHGGSYRLAPKAKAEAKPKKVAKKKSTKKAATKKTSAKKASKPKAPKAASKPKAKKPAAKKSATKAKKSAPKKAAA